MVDSLFDVLCIRCVCVYVLWFDGDMSGDSVCVFWMWKVKEDILKGNRFQKKSSEGCNKVLDDDSMIQWQENKSEWRKNEDDGTTNVRNSLFDNLSWCTIISEGVKYWKHTIQQVSQTSKNNNKNK